MPCYGLFWMESPYSDLWWRFHYEHYFLWESPSSADLWNIHTQKQFTWSPQVITHSVVQLFCELLMGNKVYCLSIQHISSMCISKYFSYFYAKVKYKQTIQFMASIIHVYNFNIICIQYWSFSCQWVSLTSENHEILLILWL